MSAACSSSDGGTGSSFAKGWKGFTIGTSDHYASNGRQQPRSADDTTGRKQLNKKKTANRFRLELSAVGRRAGVPAGDNEDRPERLGHARRTPARFLG